MHGAYPCIGDERQVDSLPHSGLYDLEKEISFWNGLAYVEDA